MARMHARKKGKSSSTHPPSRTAPDWTPMSAEEVTKKVIELAKSGYSMSLIGLILRDQYGVPSVKMVVGKSIKRILAEANLLPEYPEDLTNLMRKALRLHRHLQTHRQDRHNRRALELTESKIRRLVRYYKSRGVLPADWYYDPQKAALIVKE